MYVQHISLRISVCVCVVVKQLGSLLFFNHTDSTSNSFHFPSSPSILLHSRWRQGSRGPRTDALPLDADSAKLNADSASWLGKTFFFCRVGTIPLVIFGTMCVMCFCSVNLIIIFKCKKNLMTKEAMHYVWGSKVEIEGSKVEMKESW